MIRSKIIPGLRIRWRGQGAHSSENGVGILFSRSLGHLRIYIEELTAKFSTQINLGLHEYREIDILILDKEDVLLDELLTGDNKTLREFAKKLVEEEINKSPDSSTG